MLNPILPPLLSVCLACVAATTLPSTAPSPTAEARRRLAEGDAELRPAWDALRARADALLDRGPWSVVDNDFVPPSGDNHDYASFGSYWWPDPDKPDGLPYVRRDGLLNPETDARSDNHALLNTAEAARVLSLAYVLGGDERYARRAALVLRQCFLDEATRMNPHLRYGQAISGITEGRGIGIIDTKALLDVVDAARLLEQEDAPGWSEADAAGLRAWCAAYLDWLRTSDLGRDESRTTNNHGTYYDAQVASLALFVGRDDVARRVLTEAVARRLDVQVNPNGSQPKELARTRSWDYSTMNLLGLMRLAELGERAGVDLWHAPAPDGGEPLLKRAADYLAPYADPAVAWPHEQILALDRGRLLHPLLMARRAYGGYGRALGALPAGVWARPEALVCAAPAGDAMK